MIEPTSITRIEGERVYMLGKELRTLHGRTYLQLTHEAHPLGPVITIEIEDGRFWQAANCGTEFEFLFDHHGMALPWPEVRQYVADRLLNNPETLWLTNGLRGHTSRFDQPFNESPDRNAARFRIGPPGAEPSSSRIRTRQVDIVRQNQDLFYGYQQLYARGWDGVGQRWPGLQVPYEEWSDGLKRKYAQLREEETDAALPNKPG